MRCEIGKNCHCFPSRLATSLSSDLTAYFLVPKIHLGNPFFEIPVFGQPPRTSDQSGKGRWGFPVWIPKVDLGNPPNPKAYTVKLVTSPSQAEKSRFIDPNIAHLALDSLAFSDRGNQRERNDPFFGAFDTAAQTRTAIAALLLALVVDRPGVRQFDSIQESIR